MTAVTVKGVAVGQTEVPSGAPRARGDRTRAALVEAALARFGAKGVERTSVDEITADAAVAKGTFYVHFQRKEDVLLERAAQLTVEVEAAVAATSGSAVETLRALGGRFAALLSAEPSRPLVGRTVRELVGNPEHWLRVVGDRPTLVTVNEPIVARGQRGGELRRDQSALRLAQALTTLWLDNVIGWAERDADLPLAHDLERALDLFVDGARAR